MTANMHNQDFPMVFVACVLHFQHSNGSEWRFDLVYVVLYVYIHVPENATLNTSTAHQTTNV